MVHNSSNAFMQGARSIQLVVLTMLHACGSGGISEAGFDTCFLFFCFFTLFVFVSVLVFQFVVHSRQYI